jgi:hypothetical protein
MGQKVKSISRKKAKQTSKKSLKKSSSRSGSKKSKNKTAKKTSKRSSKKSSSRNGSKKQKAAKKTSKRSSKKSSSRSKKQTKTSKRNSRSSSNKNASKRSAKKTSKKPSANVTKKTLKLPPLNQSTFQNILASIFEKSQVPKISPAASNTVTALLQPLVNVANKNSYDQFLDFLKSRLGKDSNLYSHILDNANVSLKATNYDKQGNIIDYLLYEILELSGSNALIQNNTLVVSPKHVKTIIQSDTELKKLFR